MPMKSLSLLSGLLLAAHKTVASLLETKLRPTNIPPYRLQSAFDNNWVITIHTADTQVREPLQLNSSQSLASPLLEPFNLSTVEENGKTKGYQERLPAPPSL